MYALLSLYSFSKDVVTLIENEDESRSGIASVLYPLSRVLVLQRDLQGTKRNENEHYGRSQIRISRKLILRLVPAS
jgi:hypothetical protein